MSQLSREIESRASLLERQCHKPIAKNPKMTKSFSLSVARIFCRRQNHIDLRRQNHIDQFDREHRRNSYGIQKDRPSQSFSQSHSVSSVTKNARQSRVISSSSGGLLNNSHASITSIHINHDSLYNSPLDSSNWGLSMLSVESRKVHINSILTLNTKRFFSSNQISWGKEHGGKQSVMMDLCIVPLGKLSVSHEIAQAEKILRNPKYKLDVKLHAYGTNIHGDWDDVMTALKVGVFFDFENVCRRY